MAGNRSIENVIFFENATSSTDGKTYNIASDASTLNIDFIKTENTTFTAHFEGKLM